MRSLLWSLFCCLATLVPLSPSRADDKADLKAARLEAEKLHNAKKYAEAEVAYEKVVRLAAKAYGADHIVTADLLNNFALTYDAHGKNTEAEALYLRSLAILVKVNGKDHVDTVLVLVNLGILYARQGKNAEADALFKRGIDIREKALGKEDPEVAAVLHHLANHTKLQKRYDEAEALYQRTVAILEKSLGKEHIKVAFVLHNQGILYTDWGKPALAAPIYLRCLPIMEKRFGAEYIEIAKTHHLLGNAYKAMKKHAEAAAAFQRCLAIREKALGKEHIEVARLLYEIGEAYRELNKNADAEVAYQRCLAIREKVLGQEHPDVAMVADQLAIVYKQQAKYELAETLFQRSLAIQEKTHGKEHFEVAKVLNSLGLLYVNQEKHAQAEPLLQRSVAIREKVYGSDDLRVATPLENLANACSGLGKLADAEKHHRRVVAIREKAQGKEHTALIIPLNNLGLLCVERHQYVEADSLYQRALAICEKASGKRQGESSMILNNWGLLYELLGKYAAADSCYRRSLAINEKEFGTEHVRVARSLLNLANLQTALGKLDDAETLLKRALVVHEKIYGADAVSVGKCVANLANVHRARNQFAEAEPLYLRALAIFEKASAQREIALTCNNLGIVKYGQGKHAEAETLYLRGVTIEEKLRGKGCVEAALPLSNLANLYKSQEKSVAAEAVYRRCLTIYEKAFGAEHPAAHLALHNLVRICVNQERYADAAAWETRLRQATRQFLLRELPSLSAPEQQAFLNLAEKLRFTAALSIAHRKSKDPVIVEPSAAWLLNGKAIALEAQTIRGRLERDITTDQDRAMLAEIQSIRAREATLALQKKPPEDARKLRDQLELRRRELEKNLAQASGTAAQLANPWVELADVRRQIPANGVLIDIARFRVDQFSPKTEIVVVRPARYVAWVIPPASAGQIRIVDLGDAAAIDRAIQEARQALESTVDRLEKRESEKKLEADAAEKLGAVAKRIFAPLKPHLGQATQLIISPDGDLWLLPWAALPTGKDRYLIEDYTLRYVVSGRDLVEHNVGKKPETTPALILADPDYNLTPAQVAQARPLPINPDNAIAAVTRSTDLRGVGRVKRLPGTVAEAKQAFEKLKALTGQEPTLYKEAAASEAAVKASRSPQVLVLATHGFFLKSQEVDPKADSGNDEQKTAVVKDKEGKEVENPLVRCGLLLAGANKRAEAKEGEDDGILTGLEIVGLDLRGTRMVVLSACETGVGDVQNGEGVAGLRQAFQLAGAESVLATLWQISDKATSELMNSFYDELAKETERSEALTRAQRQFIKERRETAGAAHPFFWASFTLTGK